MKLFACGRRLAFFAFLTAVAGVGYAYYLQYGVGLEPCPLCIFQRVGLVALGVFSLIFALLPDPYRLNKKAKNTAEKSATYAINKPLLFGKWLLWMLATLGVLWSAGVAARHVWLTYLPADQVPACGAGLDFWLKTQALPNVLKLVLTGSGECAKIDWTLFGISLPEQALAFFVLLLLLQGAVAWRLARNPKYPKHVIG